MKLTFDCPRCESFIEATVMVEPLVRGQYSGPPEHCFPDEGGFLELAEHDDECPRCHYQFNRDDDLLRELFEQWEEHASRYYDPDPSDDVPDEAACFGGRNYP